MSREGSAESGDRVNGSGTNSDSAAEAARDTTDDTAEAHAESAGEGTPESSDASVEGEVEAGEESEAEQLRRQLEDAEARAQDYWDRLLRTEAEKDNLRKRGAREAESARTQGLEKIATEILPVLDSLEMGVSAARESDADIEQIREGNELTLNMLLQAMDKCGIEAIDPVGEKFDPEQHQAMTMQESGEHESNTVIAVMQKGYRLNSRLLRPAMVIVAK